LKAWLPVGDTAIYLRVDSKHRSEGFRMMEEFMNRLKKDVPIWKTGIVGHPAKSPEVGG
jgi:molybdopterin synthase catalytic subunit